jgi:nucleotide-binding universal stress UspA family protein
MSIEQRRPVVVGVDGSDSSRAALAYGAWEAHRRGVPLRLVHSQFVTVPYASLGLAPDPAVLTSTRDAAIALLADHEKLARHGYPSVDVSVALVAGSPAGALVDESAHAGLVVVGSRGLGGFAGLMLGSVGTQLAAHCKAPLVVMRPPEEGGSLGVGPPHRPVVVGIDGVPDSNAALAFALEQAAARGVALHALYAWWTVSNLRKGPMDMRQYDAVDAENEARRMLSEATAGWGEAYPDVDVTLVPVHSLNPTLALLEASEEAGLLVVSRHGGNALTRLLLGSVGDAAVRDALCPVAVVPEPST